MSGFLLPRHAALPAYVPGKHDEGGDVIRLNTNESPYPPSPGVLKAVAGEVGKLNFYNDPDCTALHAALARENGVPPACVLATNGSDEALYLAFLAFADEAHPIALPDVTYGYYALFAALHGIPLHRVALRPDFTVDPEDYMDLGEMIVLANPNAPTGLALGLSQIEAIAKSNPRNVVLIDEAYVDFGGQTAAPLIGKCPNLLIVRTYSKSRSMAGARLGYALGDPALMEELGRIHNAAGLYSVSRMAQAAGIAACEEAQYYRENCARIVQTRQFTARRLRELGFETTDSLGNFLFARHPAIPGAQLQRALERRGVLVRHFAGERTEDYLRITIGTQEQMRTMLRATQEILQEREETDAKR